MGATFTIEEKVSLSNLAAQIAQVTVLTANLANFNWSTLPGKPTTFVYTDQLYSDPSWLSISKTFVGLGNVENTALSTWLGSNVLNTVANNLSFAGSAFLYSAAANTISQRNGTTAQKLEIYNTYTNSTNYERSAVYWSGNQLYIGTEKAGTGTGRVVNIGSNPTGAPDAQLILQGATVRIYSTSSYFGIDSSSNPFPGTSSGTLGVIGTPWNALYLKTSAQIFGPNSKFEIYNSYTDVSNYERGVFDWTTTANALTIGTQSAGTGTARALVLTSANGQINVTTTGAVWQFLNGGFRVASDNTGTFGGLSSNRPQSVYAYGKVIASGAASVIEAWNTDAAVSTVNYEKGVFDWTTTASTLTIGTYAGGTGVARSTLISSASSVTLQSRTNGAVVDSASGLIAFQKASTTIWQITTAGTFGTQTDGGQDIGNSGGQRPNNVHILGFLNMYGGSNAIDCYNAGLSIRARSATGGIYFATGGTTARWGFDQNGQFLPQVDNTYDIGSSGNSVRQLYLSKTITAAGTTGAQTINKSAGSVNFAAAATSLVVTNSLVTTSSVIVATVGTNDTTMKTVSVTVAAGSFTLTANAAATAETRVNFVVLS